MMRLAITFLLSLCFLLSGAYSHLFARTYQNSISLAQAKLTKNSASAGSCTEKANQTIIRKATSSATDNDAIDAEEIDDDDEFHFSRKQVAIINCFLSFFSAQVSDGLHQHLNNRLPVCTHFSYTASSKYIVQRVIRI